MPIAIPTAMLDLWPMARALARTMNGTKAKDINGAMAIAMTRVLARGLTVVEAKATASAMTRAILVTLVQNMV